MAESSGLRKLNNFPTVIAVGLALYIIVTPFVPELSYWWNQRFGQALPLWSARDRGVITANLTEVAQ
jgi:hypothetical protein